MSRRGWTAGGTHRFPESPSMKELSHPRSQQA
jgi:hypothetical protein